MSRTWFIVASLGWLGAYTWAWVGLPEDRVPVHFDGLGRPDRYADRTEFLVINLVAGVAVWASMLFLARWVGRPRTIETTSSLRWINVPNKQWWIAHPVRLRELRLRLREDCYLFGALTVGFLGALLVFITRAARTDPVELGYGFFIALGGYVAGVLGYALHVARRRYLPEE